MKSLVCVFLTLGCIVMLAGCSNHGDKQSADDMASQILSDYFDGASVTISDETSDYDSSNNEWDIQGMVQYTDSQTGPHALFFELVEHTDDNKMWTRDSLDLHH